MENSVNKPSFTKVVKRDLRKGLTFFGVPANTILVVFAIVLLILNIAPILSVFETSLTVGPNEFVPDAESGDWTFYHFYEVFADFQPGLALQKQYSWNIFYKPFFRSLLISVLTCAFAIIFGGLAAYLICRTNMRFKKFISAVFIFPYIMPQWTLALFWKNFFVSTAFPGGYVGEFQALTGLAAPQWFVYGFFPIALILGLHYAPFAYILIGGVLRNMDSNLEEAATILNIPKWKVFLKVTVPILKPALLSTILLVFSSAMSSYAVPVTLGKPINYEVLATWMKYCIEGSGGYQRGAGAIMSIVLILIGVIILTMNQIQTGSRKQFTTVTGKSGQASVHNLGKAGKYVIGTIFCIVVTFFCIGPMVSFGLESFLPNPGDYSSGLTPEAWISKDVIRNDLHGIFYEKKVWRSLGGSLLLSVLCSLFAGTFGLLIGYAVSKKRKSKFANFVNGLAFFPYLIPSISLSLVFFLLATSMKVAVGSLWWPALWTCVIVGTIKYIPFSSRSSLNAMMQLSGEIEEAAVIQHIPWWKRMTRIIFPIQKSAFISGYLLPFISCMRELSLFVFIGPDDIVLTRFMFFLNADGIPALENAANLLLVVIILLVNYLVNLLTGASIDKGIGGGK